MNFLLIFFISVFINKKLNCSTEHINYRKRKFHWKHTLALNDILKRKLQINSFIIEHMSVWKFIWRGNIIMKYFEKMIASDNNYWNNCTVAHIVLKLHKLTGSFIILRGRLKEGGGGRAEAAPFLFFAITCFFCNHFEELQTVLFEVELIINNAPLT